MKSFAISRLRDLAKGFCEITQRFCKIFFLHVPWGGSVVMPPFPPPNPYMEVPAYIMPRPHMQPVDYRRVSSTPRPRLLAYQNPYPPCRVRPHHTDPVTETVKSEVQTEPQQRGGGFSEESPLISADLGSV